MKVRLMAAITDGGAEQMSQWNKVDGVTTEAYGRRVGRLHLDNAAAIASRAFQDLALVVGSAVAIMMLLLTPAHAVEPFDRATTPSQSSGLTMLWHDLQTEVAKDEVEITHCRMDSKCSAAAQRLIAIIDEARRYSGRRMIGHLNRGINGAIRSTRAIAPWLPPLAALDQPGDCKSYAIVKYLALGELGIAPSDRRLVMLRGASRPNEIHLVVLVRDDGRWIILDNQTLALVDSVAARQYEPLKEFDARGVRDF